MKDLFTAKQVNVAQALDIVQLQLGSNKIRLYYQTTFKICSSLQGATKFAMRHEGNKPDLWNKLAAYDRSECSVKLHREYRRSGYVTNLTNWEVAFEGSLVILKLDDLTAKFYYPDAARLNVMLRRAAKQAKHWAGDRSRIWNTYARLSDAEENDKVLYIW